MLNKRHPFAGLIVYTIDDKLGGLQLPAAAEQPPGGDASDPGPDLSAAVQQQQLGSGLVARKANIDVVVIDRLEKVPSEN
jgi:uncharacterized protein (TIGR03435 family)